MELLLIRHGLPHREVSDAGPADPGLDEIGRTQAEALAAWLAPERIDALYASPLRRARETAEPLARHTGLRVEIDEDLAEWDRHADSYIPLEEMKAEGHPLLEAMANEQWEVIGVDPDAFAERIVHAIDRISTAHPSQRVAIFSHGGVINAYVATALGLDRRLFFEPGYTSISRILVSRGARRSVRSLNECGHIRDI